MVYHSLSRAQQGSMTTLKTPVYQLNAECSPAVDAERVAG